MPEDHRRHDGAGRFARLVAFKVAVTAALVLVLTLLALRSVGLL
ncbi:hypothetical protein [Benzoatithermus flavus]|uniref:Uncharacterized protein n=1 Tax=Benzoatithermus flavus TaxID=3108223 RepID=A0ABU8XPL1_9PROT